jgi:hypothetical protein
MNYTLYTVARFAPTEAKYCGDKEAALSLSLSSNLGSGSKNDSA